MREVADQTLLKSWPSVTVHMPSRRNGRRFALVSKILSELKIHHQAVFPFWRRLQLKGVDKDAARSPFCQMTWKIPAATDILITDQKAVNQTGKTIHIDYDFMKYLESRPNQDVLFLPILFHPNLINEASYETAAQFSKNLDRPIGVLFAGNCDPKTYNNNLIQSRYGLANRHELYNCIKQMPKENVYIPTSKSEFLELLEDGSLATKFVWIDTEKFRFPQNEWLGLLAKARYFFCTPGVHYPYCQNLNEAAACGSVPILQYPDFYHPGLINGQDCLSFKETSELAALVANVLPSKDNAFWLSRSKAIVQWHKDYLSLEHAHAQIQQFMHDPDKRQLTWVLAGK